MLLILDQLPLSLRNKGKYLSIQYTYIMDNSEIMELKYQNRLFEHNFRLPMEKQDNIKIEEKN
ncbi:unnamed protein product [Paramecium sonneborni]|uniref:Uncharacterized protein n=1 Tax=Paramecium sonneborni TaxID=65129 RepID=A0A8S1PQN6_9CILI|nr:unnamed protein product [Paramecium sonneborni]